MRQRNKVLRQRYQTIGNAELKLGLDVNYYMGKCSTNVEDNSQRIKLIPGNWEVLTILTQTQKLEVVKELYNSLHYDGKVACCSDIFFNEEDSNLKRIITSILKSSFATENNMEEMVKVMDEAFLSLAISNGLTSNPKCFASNSVKAMKRLSSENKPNLVYKFSQMLTLQKSNNSAEQVIPRAAERGG